MGNSKSVFTDEQLEEYQDLTFLNKKEILHVFDRFRELDPKEVGLKYDKNVRLPKETIMKLPELKVNPFLDRICAVFSSENDGTISFEDFLDMISVFSDSATKEVKVEYAFRIYDFNNDDRIDKEDLKQLIELLMYGPKPNEMQLEKFSDDQENKKKLDKDQMEHLINHILKEGDLDGDDALSFAEFQHVLSKTPDFFSSFRIHL